MALLQMHDESVQQAVCDLRDLLRACISADEDRPAYAMC